MFKTCFGKKESTQLPTPPLSATTTPLPVAPQPLQPVSDPNSLKNKLVKGLKDLGKDIKDFGICRAIFMTIGILIILACIGGFGFALALSGGIALIPAIFIGVGAAIGIPVGLGLVLGGLLYLLNLATKGTGVYSGIHGHEFRCYCCGMRC